MCKVENICLNPQRSACLGHGCCEISNTSAVTFCQSCCTSEDCMGSCRLHRLGQCSVSTEFHPGGGEAQRAMRRSQDTWIKRPENLRVGGNFNCLIHQFLCQAANQHHASRDKELTTFQVPGLNSWMFCLILNRNSSLLRFYPSTPALPFFIGHVAEMCRQLSAPTHTTPLFSCQKSSSYSHLPKTGEADSSLTEVSDLLSPLFLTMGCVIPIRDMVRIQ